MSPTKRISSVYPVLQNNIYEDQFLRERAILAPKNDVVCKINLEFSFAMIINKAQG